MTERAAPFLSPVGAALAIGLGLALCWPMLASGALFTLFDTQSYLNGGRVLIEIVTDTLGLSGGGGGGGGGGMSAVDDASPDFVRSIIYSLYAYVSYALGGPVAMAAGQGAITLFMLFALIGPAAAARPAILAGGFAYLLVLSPLPFYTVYLMPDLLAAVVVLHGALLIRRIDALATWQVVVAVAFTAFAVGSHYGHVPLAAGLFALVVLWRVLTRRFTKTLVIAAVAPLLFAPIANLTASTVALDKPSTAPLRLPILLARSLQDGPARWYLQDACPEADLAFCRAFGDDIPERISQLLWDDTGVKSLTQDQMTAIRAEEYEILARAFLDYPVAQTVSLFGNSALQVVRIGTDEIAPVSELDTDFSGIDDGDLGTAERILAVYDALLPWGVWLPALALLGLAATRRLTREQGEILGVVVLGLLINAAIFGGLSAPVDRYQSRIAWLLPALTALALAELQGRRHRATGAYAPARA